MIQNNFPRNGLIWLLVSLICVYLPLQAQLPLWTALVFISVVAWRWMMHLGRWPYPNKLVKVLVVVLGVGAVLVSAQGQFHLESATSFILVASLLKVLEIKTQRDGYIVIFLSFFLLSISFLYAQGILITLYSLFAVWVLMSALVGLHQNQYSEQSTPVRIKTAGKTSFQILLLSLPLMLILFILFPRMGPLWSLNLQSDKAKTGLSEQMSPGDIAELSNSDELVFRVAFKDKVPANHQLYWRALVLEKHQITNGQSQWSVSKKVPPIDWYPKSWQPEPKDGVLDYTIIQEATSKKWLVGLRGVAAMEKGIGMTDTDLIVSNKKLHQRKEYEVRSWPSMDIAKQGIHSLTRQQNTQLSLSPQGTISNPQSYLLAQTLYRNHNTDLARVEAVMAYFSDQPFSYTLKPQRMAENDIDDFLFNQQAGFCAHYSSSMVFVLRSMGIPARVVAGYQGGELNKESGHITVRQYDAHAWVEVWLAGIGWKSFDPTAQVAPDRINLGLRDSLTDQAEFLSNSGLSLTKLSSFPLFNQLRLQLDELNYFWHQTVLNFNKQRQGNLLKKWLGNDFLSTSLYWLAGLFCTVFLLLTLFLLWQRPNKKRSPIEKALSVLDKKMHRYQLQRQANEGLADYSQRLQLAFPEHKDSIRRLLQQLQEHYYSKQKAQTLREKESKISIQIKGLAGKLKLKDQ